MPTLRFLSVATSIESFLAPHTIFLDQRSSPALFCRPRFDENVRFFGSSLEAQLISELCEVNRIELKIQTYASTAVPLLKGRRGWARLCVESLCLEPQGLSSPARYRMIYQRRQKGRRRGVARSSLNGRLNHRSFHPRRAL